MKRIGTLFLRIADRHTLAVGAARAARGKRKRSEVQRFFASYEANVSAIGSALREGKYTFSGYRQFQIRDPKSRVIHAPTFQDRVVHHAMIHVVGPTFEMGACEQSFACRKRKGQHVALNLASRWIHSGKWFFKADIEKFYDSIRHEMVRTLLRRRFGEASLLELFDRLLGSYCSEPEKGLPIGALTSQYLGNFYLDSLDRWAKQTMGVRHYLRYMDDMLFIGTRDQMREVQRQIRLALECLGLRVKEDGQLNRCDQGVPYLGFTLYPHRIRLNPLGRKRLRRRTRQLQRCHQTGAISEAELQQRVSSMFAHATFADDVWWRRAICADTLMRGSQEPGDAWRLDQEHCPQVPLGVSQQEQGR